MTESTPPEGQQPLTQAQIRELQRSLTEQVLDRAASDPEWRQLLIDDPELAMREANFPAAQELGEQGPPLYPREREVAGQIYGYYDQNLRGYYGGYGRQRRRPCRRHWSWSYGYHRSF